MANVLVCDDEPVTIRGLKRFIEREGYTTFTALNAREAMEVMKKREVDILITDVKMPMVDGFTLVEEIKKSGAKKIVFSCPSCYHTFSHEYPEMEGVELVHHTEFIKELIEEGRLELSQPLDTIASYHDPCDLGRNSGEYEVPRQVVRSLPGVDYREFPSNREMALCCGGGGDVEISNPELTSKVSRGVIEAASEVEARTIITACQQCKRVINSASKESAQGKYRVKDIAELVLEATEEKK